MPKPKQHQEKADHNRQFLGSITNDSFCDWQATSAFYVAVHLVEKLRAYHGEHSENHDDWDRVVRRDYARIYNAYHQLFNASIIARYKSIMAFNIPPREVKTKLIDGFLVEIENFVRNETATRTAASAASLPPQNTNT